MRNPVWVEALAAGELPAWARVAAAILGWSLVMIAVPGYLTRAGDLQLYLGLGNVVLAGGHIYRDLPPGGATWPPFFALWCVPLALLGRLGPVPVRAAWLAANFAAIWFILRTLVRLLHGRELAVRPGRHELGLLSLEVFVPLAWCWTFLDADLGFLQVNLLILALEVAALGWLMGGLDGRAGAAVGFAAALKVMPGLLIVYLAWRRRWRAFGWAVTVAAGCSLVPGVVFGWGRLLEFFRDWPRAVSAGWGVNGPNQSLYALADRWIGHGIRPWSAQAVPLTYLPPSGEATVTVVWAVLALTLVAGLAWRTRGRPLQDAAGVVAEFGAVLVASILLSPLTWIHYFVVLLVPLAALTARLRSSRDPAERRGIALALAAAAVLILPSSVDVAGRWAAAVWLNDGSLTVAGLAVLAASLRLAGRSEAASGKRFVSRASVKVH